MRSLYVHIPFCRQACRYCDFCFTVSQQYQEQYTRALLRELELRPPDKDQKPLKSLYFGGGTPSILSMKHMEKILSAIMDQYAIEQTAELTLETNPDNLNREQLTRYRQMGWNRISIGIQSFDDRELELLRRSHTASQAMQCIKESRKAGFENISIDLMYGIPGQTSEYWISNLDRALAMEVDHFSAYHLTIEEGTVFDLWSKKGRILPVGEEESIKQYFVLLEKARKEGFEHYEISNFARTGKRSRHNQVYWSGETYRGYGPSAHSFEKGIRSWNTTSLKEYIIKLNEGVLPAGFEEPGMQEQYHDYLITSLRTSSGADIKLIKKRFGEKTGLEFEKTARRFSRDGSMYSRKDRWFIHPGHWIRADYLIREFFSEKI